LWGHFEAAETEAGREEGKGREKKMKRDRRDGKNPQINFS